MLKQYEIMLVNRKTGEANGTGSFVFIDEKNVIDEQIKMNEPYNPLITIMLRPVPPLPEHLPESAEPGADHCSCGAHFTKTLTGCPLCGNSFVE